MKKKLAIILSAFMAFPHTIGEVFHHVFHYASMEKPAYALDNWTEMTNADDLLLTDHKTIMWNMGKWYPTSEVDRRIRQRFARGRYYKHYFYDDGTTKMSLAFMYKPRFKKWKIAIFGFEGGTATQVCRIFAQQVKWFLEQENVDAVYAYVPNYDQSRINDVLNIWKTDYFKVKDLTVRMDGEWWQMGRDFVGPQYRNI